MEQINREILEKLNQLQIDISFIKNNVVDMDSVMTAKERSRHEESLEEFERGEGTSLEDFKREFEGENI